MHELFSLVDAIKPIIVGLLRLLWWLIWDACFHTIGWFVGWSVLKILALGRFPALAYHEQEYANAWLAFAVEVSGIALIAALLWWLTDFWPS